jgi:glycosyltransferase involved in cell wall biosynthesis
LAQAIARLQDDRSLARRLGEAARAKALTEYGERRIVARTLDVYYELLGEPSTGADLLQDNGRSTLRNPSEH